MDTGAQLGLTSKISSTAHIHSGHVEICTIFEVNHSPFHIRIHFGTRIQFGAMVAILLYSITEFAMAPFKKKSSAPQTV